MTRPGDRLRAMAARVCRAETMERLIDPLVADLQSEHAEATRQGRLWKSHWVRMAGYVAFLKVIAFAVCEGSMGTLHERTADDRQTLRRTIGFSICGIVVATLLLTVLGSTGSRGWTWWTPVIHARVLLILVPQALPLAIPVGLLLGILCGFAGRAVSRRSRAAVLLISLVCSVASFATLAWIIPAGNQAFRQSLIGRGAVSKGSNEMTVGELREQIDSYTASPMAGSSLVRALKFSYHQRWALSCTSLVFALFALSTVPRRRAGWVPIVAVLVCFGYQTVSWQARNLVMSAALSPFMAAWLPNAVFVLATIGLVAAASRRSDVTV